MKTINHSMIDKATQDCADPYLCDPLWVGQCHRNFKRDGNFVDFEIGIRTNYSSGRKIHAFTTQMLPKSAFFSFEALGQPLDRFLVFDLVGRREQ